MWVYSGEGEAEVRGFFPFLEKTFSGCRFERKTPVSRKGPKPNKASSHGRKRYGLVAEDTKEISF